MDRIFLENQGLSAGQPASSSKIAIAVPETDDAYGASFSFDLLLFRDICQQRLRDHLARMPKSRAVVGGGCGFGPRGTMACGHYEIRQVCSASAVEVVATGIAANKK